MKRWAVASTLVGTIALVSVQPALAARVYNYTNVTMNVEAGGYKTTLEPGKRSESLNWPTMGVNVWYTFPRSLQSHKACEFQRWQHEIVGGNYLVISQSGQGVQCVMCDADHRELAKRGPSALDSQVPKKSGPFEGC